MSLEKRIEDEKPPLGSWVLCQYKPGQKSWGSYQVLFMVITALSQPQPFGSMIW